MSIKLLVADDSITIQKVIGIIFGGEEYSLTVVDNGNAAVEKAREICPDVLLIDALMPGMSGYEVSETIRSIPELADKPILILTGSFEPFDEDKARKCGADDFMAKPFESQQIVNKVRELAAIGSTRTHLTASPQPAILPVAEAEPVMSVPFEMAAVVAPQPEPDVTPPVDDIWGAFTTEAEPFNPLETEPSDASDTGQFLAEPDVFEMVNEEAAAHIIQPFDPVSSPPQQTDRSWIPVEETIFEFEEETVAEIPATDPSTLPLPLPEASFGDISFDELQSDYEPVVAESEEYASSAVETYAAVPVILESAAIVATPPAASTTEVPTLTEEQLRAAVSAASKEIIERIVWEVVPDLAEALIKEAIRKIKEGQ